MGIFWSQRKELENLQARIENNFTKSNHVKITEGQGLLQEAVERIEGQISRIENTLTELCNTVSEAHPASPAQAHSSAVHETLDRLQQQQNASEQTLAHLTEVVEDMVRSVDSLTEVSRRKYGEGTEQELEISGSGSGSSGRSAQQVTLTGTDLQQISGLLEEKHILIEQRLTHLSSKQETTQQTVEHILQKIVPKESLLEDDSIPQKSLDLMDGSPIDEDMIDTDAQEQCSYPASEVVINTAEKGHLQSFSDRLSESSSRFTTGDKVRIEIGVEVLYAMHNNESDWEAGMADCIGHTGTVLAVEGHRINIDFGLYKRYRFFEEALTKTYVFEEGTTVLVVDDMDSLRKCQTEGPQKHGGWCFGMEQIVGKRGILHRMDDDGDAVVLFGTEQWKWTLSPECLTVSNDPPDAAIYPPMFLVIPEESTTPLDKLFKFIEMGDEIKVKELINDDPTLVNAAGAKRSSALHIASQCGNLALVKLLVECRAPLEAADEEGNTPFLCAVKSTKEEIVIFLLTSAINKKASNLAGASALHIAATNNDASLVCRLLQAGCDVNKEDGFGETPLSIAVETGTEEIIARFLSCPNIQPSHKDCVGFTPLLCAARHGKKSVVALLTTKFPKLLNEDTNADGFTALHLAIYNNHDDIVCYLVSQEDIDLNSRASKQRTPLHLAASEGFLRIAKELIQKGADVNLTDESGNTSLHLCLSRSQGVQEETSSAEEDREFAEYLVANGAMWDMKNNEGQTPRDIKPDGVFRWPSTRSIYQEGLLEPASESTGVKHVSVRREAINPSVEDSEVSTVHDQTRDSIGTSKSQSIASPTDKTGHVPLCSLCEEREASIQLKPCNDLFCVGCIGKDPKKCLSCKEKVTDKLNLAIRVRQQ